jgi:hypothetical protein
LFCFVFSPRLLPSVGYLKETGTNHRQSCQSALGSAVKNISKCNFKSWENCTPRGCCSVKNDKCEVLENVSIDKEKPTKYIPHCSLTPLFFSRQASGRVNQICDHLHLLGRDSFHVAHWNHLKEPQGVWPGASAEDRPLAAPVHFQNTKKYLSPQTMHIVTPNLPKN